MAEKVVAAVLYPDFQMLDATGPLEAFALTNRLLGGDPAYKVVTTARQKGPVEASSGLTLMAQTSWDQLGENLDTLIFIGGRGVRTAMKDKDMLFSARRLSGMARRTASVCTGAFLLAEAGLLNGRRATTHWDDTDQLAREYPRISVQRDDIYVRDGQFVTAAGVTAGIDLALALIEEDHGRDVALATARMLVVYLKRPGGQSQFSRELSAQATSSSRFERLRQWIFDNLDKPLSVEDLADQAAMAPRSLARRFAQDLGVTPAKFVEHARIDAARRDLEDGGLTIDKIAANRGFGGADRMRRSFQRSLGVSPQEYRDRFRSKESV
ncbi:GlxA family transcriptional regulator [Hwanghaeella grinnelliae]|uniref:GlxA family transcriptional regulator n=1 Tax=Hwanghaeella grinnelliae TaxID=2500179 RepID=A0A3S3UP22_9PROT|nr:GlxA family transcriptional regulator [Hwanghaeella grinnelliae]RVU36504.1 GlxA family transcriptional regulator [Hwanghaeella grinnelliae]